MVVALSLFAAAPPVAWSQTSSEERWVEERLAALTLEEKIGQLILPRCAGDFLSDEDPQLVELEAAARAGRIGGVVLFAGGALETRATIERLESRSSIPLLVASDYEWGTAMRLGGGTRFPRAMALGATGSLEDVEAAARVTAREARALGVHLVLAPVLDLGVEPASRVVNNRSFGADPRRVAELGVAWVRAAQSEGILAVVKHYPGHGATSEDSHHVLPELAIGESTLRRRELVPFAAAVDAGVAGVMPAHLMVPSVDLERPASRSSALLDGILRGELGFQGLIVTDALEMEGAKGTWAGAVAVESIAAGVDVLLMPPDPNVTHDALMRAIARGELSEERIDRSVRRVLAAKARVGLHRVPPRTTPGGSLTNEIGRPLDARLAASVASRALTALQWDPERLPLSSRRPPKVLLLSLLGDGDRTTEPRFLRDALRLRSPSVEHRMLTPAALAGRAALVEDSVARAEVVVVAHYAHGSTWAPLASPAPGSEVDGETAPEPPAALLLDWIEQWRSSGKTVVVVSLADPWALLPVPEVDGLLTTYDPAPASQAAAAAALFGETSIEGRLPVSLAPRWGLGEGRSLAARYGVPPAAGPPEAVGLSSDGLERAIDILEQGIEARAMPGAVALVMRHGKIALHRSLGRMSYEPDAPAMEIDTIFDLASLTKVIVTTTLAMLETERGNLALELPVAAYLPEFEGERKSEVLVADLLTHSGGILWWTDLYRRYGHLPPAEAKRAYLREIFALPLESPPGAEMRYSDLGLLLMGEILERITATPLDVAAQREIFGPLGMKDTRFRPPAALRSRIAPTELDSEWRGRVVHGEVHDENAFGLGGVAPHAGLFSTALDLARFAQMLLDGGVYDGERLLRGDTVALFTRRAERIEGSSRALGWDTPSEPSSAGRYFSSSSWGHTGFTGTSMWTDPERDVVVILLTNRVHPTRDNRAFYELRPRFHDAVMQSILDQEIAPREE